MNSANSWESDISGAEKERPSTPAGQSPGGSGTIWRRPISTGNSPVEETRTFEDLLGTLRETVRLRVQQGVITESGLARLTNISQPHLHNILKGKRLLTGELADRLLRQLHLSVGDLLPERTPEGHSAISFLDGFLGPGFPFPSSAHPHLRYPFPTLELRASRVPFFIEIRGNVPPPFQERDLAMVDLDAQTRLEPLIGAWYAVSLGQEVNLRRVWVAGDSICLSEAFPVPGQAEWFEPGNRSMLEILLARVVWFGRKLDATYLTGSTEETGSSY
jgi:hypothetical protein